MDRLTLLFNLKGKKEQGFKIFVWHISGITKCG